MSLMQLLKVGNSVREARENRGAYQSRLDTDLPRFDVDATPIADKRSLRTVADARSAQEPSLFSPRVSSEANPAQVEVETGTFPVPPPAPKPADSPFSNASAQQRNWSLKQILFVRRSRKIVEGRAVQTEWALEQVTVVRNDLSDSDLEIVPARRPLPPKPVANPSWLFWKRQREVSSSPWNRWASRIFAMRKTQS